MSDFFSFMITPDKELFLKSRDIVINHEDYNPYSDDLSEIEKMLDNNDFDKVIEYNNINVLLSPRVHLYKNYALKQMGNEDDAKSELILAQRIVENIALTGNGSMELPYIVTRVSDERDLLNYLEETFRGQSLIFENDIYYDRIDTVSGRQIYFNITDCYLKIKNTSFDDLLSQIQEKPKKKWWKIW